MRKRLGPYSLAGLTTIVAAATVVALLFAGIASADGSLTWGGNGFPNATCTANSTSMLWVFNPHSGAVPTGLTINGEAQVGTWVLNGGGQDWHFSTAIDATNYPPTSASVDYTGDLGQRPILTLSHCDGDGNLPPAADLTVTKSADGSYDQSYKWTIGKAVDQSEIDVTPGATATFTYTVTVGHDAGTVSNVKVAGTITVSNPNGGDVLLSGVSDELSNSTVCDVDSSGGLTVPANNVATFPYSCDLGTTVPVDPITNTVEVTWAHQILSDNSELAVGSALFTSDPINFAANLIDNCVSVADPVDPLSPRIFCVGDAGDPTFSYSYTRTVPAPALGSCTSYDNTATFTTNTTGTTGSGSQTVTVCAFNAPLTIGYWKNHMYKCGPHDKTGTNGCNNNGPFTDDLLGKTICSGLCVSGKLSGTFTATAANALAVFNANNCANVSTSDSNAAACLAAQLLGAELNVANVSKPCICPTIANAIAFLTAVGYNGPGSKVTFTATYTRAGAIALKTALDNYNNGLGCPI